MDRLSLTTAVEGSNFTIPQGATIVVYDADGKKVDPQPTMTLHPTMGTAAGSHTIDLADGSNFPVGGSVVISQINTLNTDGAPTGSFSNLHSQLFPDVIRQSQIVPGVKSSRVFPTHRWIMSEDLMAQARSLQWLVRLT